MQSKYDVMFVPIDTSVIFGDFWISKLQINKCFVTYEISKWLKAVALYSKSKDKKKSTPILLFLTTIKFYHPENVAWALGGTICDDSKRRTVHQCQTMDNAWDKLITCYQSGPQQDLSHLSPRNNKSRQKNSTFLTQRDILVLIYLHFLQGSYKVSSYMSHLFLSYVQLKHGWSELYTITIRIRSVVDY